MSRRAILVLVLVTALVSAVLTSLVWMYAFSQGPLDPAPQGKAVTDPDDRPELVLAPSGLAIPVAGQTPESLVDTYTQARAGGARVHDAIDIMAPAGTPVVSATEGVVEKLYLSRGGGGITVYVRSPDRRWTYYYAHLQEYAPGLTEGQRVARGDRLGSVGSTGNANPAGPHLHFAVHRVEPDDPWYEGTPVNPYPLLAGARR
jgi:murein DD-endopeptidase MepM/ murein hydrolase activator NlpD